MTTLAEIVDKLERADSPGDGDPSTHSNPSVLTEDCPVCKPVPSGLYLDAEEVTVLLGALQAQRSAKTGSQNDSGKDTQEA